MNVNRWLNLLLCLPRQPFMSCTSNLLIVFSPSITLHQVVLTLWWLWWLSGDSLVTLWWLSDDGVWWVTKSKQSESKWGVTERPPHLGTGGTGGTHSLLTSHVSQTKGVLGGGGGGCYDISRTLNLLSYWGGVSCLHVVRRLETRHGHCTTYCYTVL